MARFSISLLAVLGMLQVAIAQTTTAASSPSTGKIHRVDVGEDGLEFDPSSVTAAVGDKIEFHFYQGMHSVAQGSFDSPCHPLNGTAGIFSGPVSVTSGEGKEVFTVTLENDKPIWYYCATLRHCQNGMVGVINPPSSGDETLDNYKSAAADVSINEAPSSTGGGTLGPAATGSSQSSESSESSESASASASGSAAETTSGATSSGATGGSQSTASETSTGAAASQTGGGGAGASLRSDMSMVIGSFGVAMAALVMGMMM